MRKSGEDAKQISSGWSFLTQLHALMGSFDPLLFTHGFFICLISFLYFTLFFSSLHNVYILVFEKLISRRLVVLYFLILPSIRHEQYSTTHRCLYVYVPLALVFLEENSGRRLILT